MHTWNSARSQLDQPDTVGLYDDTGELNGRDRSQPDCRRWLSSQNDAYVHGLQSAVDCCASSLKAWRHDSDSGAVHGSKVQHGQLQSVRDISVTSDDTEAVHPLDKAPAEGLWDVSRMGGSNQATVSSMFMINTNVQKTRHRWNQQLLLKQRAPSAQVDT
jgi:hypothetical protein